MDEGKNGPAGVTDDRKYPGKVGHMLLDFGAYSRSKS